MKARNPSTGNLETVYVKALDSLPVGSVLDFTGSSADVPAGWEEVYDYSTTEIDTGKKWIDGKPIYRKVFNTTSPSTTGSETTIATIGSFDTLVNMNANIDLGQYGIVPLPQAAASNNINTLAIDGKTNGNIKMKIDNVAYSSKSVIVIVEYTKSS